MHAFVHAANVRGRDAEHFNDPPRLPPARSVCRVDIAALLDRNHSAAATLVPTTSRPYVEPMTAWTNLTASFASLACVLGLSACASLGDARGGPEDPAAQLQLTSTAFLDQQPLSMRYTCEGDEVSPPLRWSQLPAKTRSLVLIVDDAESGQVFTHWLLYDLPPSGVLSEGVKATHLPLGTRQARNDAGTTGYHGACPTSGRQQYHFKLFALDTTLPDLDVPNRQQLESAMQGHILATGELVGTYARKAEALEVHDETDPDMDEPVAHPVTESRATD